MGSINYGNQIVSLPFEAKGTSFNINEMMYRLIPSGIYSGGTLAKSSSNSVSINPLVCWIQDDINKVAVKVQTKNIITLSVSSTDIYIVLRFAWVASATNYMDVFSVPFGGIESSDLIVGKCVYIGGVLQSTFDYTESSFFTLTNLQEDSQEFLVEATEPPSNQVNVLSGEFVSANKYVNFSGPSLSPALNNTILGRIDLIYVDESGAVQKVEGVDSITPIAPSYSGKMVAAEIRRGTSRTNINGSEIFLVRSLFSGIGQASISASELNFGTGIGQINASTIPTIDITALFTATNIDDSLTELELEQNYPMDSITGNESENTTAKYQVTGYAPTTSFGYSPGTTVRVTYLSGSGTFNPSASIPLGYTIYLVNVVCIGGGSGGGTGPNGPGGLPGGGGGGGGLSLAQVVINGLSQSYSVGGGGASDSAGGTTSFGSFSANGGAANGSGGAGLTANGNTGSNPNSTSSHSLATYQGNITVTGESFSGVDSVPGASYNGVGYGGTGGSHGGGPGSSGTHGEIIVYY